MKNRYRISLSFVFYILFWSALPAKGQEVNYYKSGDNIWAASTRLMGSDFHFTARHIDSTLARRAIDASILEVNRIEKMISSWDPGSQTSEINRMSGVKPVKVDSELFALIKRSLKVSRLTKGAFDISMIPFLSLWDFNGQEIEWPAKEAIEGKKSLVGWEKIVLDEENLTVFLPIKGMKIGFGAIGKGYAADKAAHKMKDLGIINGIVNASGDLVCFGDENDEQKGWLTAVADPLADDPRGFVYIKNEAVVTSGDYERNFMYEGVQYSHIIDPRTGEPTSGLSSATIICSSGELADALATSVMVLGREEGLQLINHLNGVRGFIIDDDGTIINQNN